MVTTLKSPRLAGSPRLCEQEEKVTATRLPSDRAATRLGDGEFMVGFIRNAPDRAAQRTEPARGCRTLLRRRFHASDRTARRMGPGAGGNRATAAGYANPVPAAGAACGGPNGGPNRAKGRVP